MAGVEQGRVESGSDTLQAKADIQTLSKGVSKAETPTGAQGIVDTIGNSITKELTELQEKIKDPKISPEQKEMYTMRIGFLQTMSGFPKVIQDIQGIENQINQKKQ